MRKSLLLSLLLVESLSAQYFRGVNLAGAEFGSDVLPGTYGHEYFYNSEATFRYFGLKGLNLFRVALRWERLQPQLRGPLDPENLAYLKQNVAWARNWGVKIIPEIHNFGRYVMNEGGVPREYIIDNVYGGAVKVSSLDLADFWVRMSEEFKNEPAVYAYGLMNEPHDMGTANWKVISQTVLTAIRANNDSKLVMIPGDSWSSANRWAKVHGLQGWISDPADNFKYEAHLYFDFEEYGSYQKGAYPTSYAAQLALNPSLATVGRTRFIPFRDWCRSNGVRGYLGEYGIPNDDPRWLTLLEDLFELLDEEGYDGTYWAAGEWWGDYALSVQPLNFQTDRAQLPTLLAHAGAGFFTTVSAADPTLTLAAPDSLVAGYGPNLVPAGADPAAAQVELSASSGWKQAATLLSAGPSQINYLVPAATPLGRIDVRVRYQDKVVAAGTLEVRKTAPAVFAANANGQGVAAAQVVRLRADGTQSYEELSRFDASLNRFVAAPVDFGSDRLFLVLYGTGVRNLSSGASLRVGAASLPVQYAGAQLTIAGLDQVNAELPRSLAGAGEVPVLLTVDGQPANQLTIAFR